MTQHGASSNRKRRAITALQYASEEMREAISAQERALAVLTAAQAEWRACDERSQAAIDMAKSIRASVESMRQMGLGSAENKQGTGQKK